MKRMLSAALALCLMLCAMGSVRAEETPLRVLDAWWAADAYREAYPDRTLEVIDPAWDEDGNSCVPELLRSGEWDAMCVETTDVTLAELDREGLVLDLGGVPEAEKVAERLYPAIRAGVSVDGRLVALPAGYLGTRATGYRLLGTDSDGREDAEEMKLRSQLGFTAEDQPATFAEVCALGLRYMALSREAREGTIFLFSDAAPQGFSLLYNLITTYQAEATDASGALDFDTPAFRAALEDAAPLLAAFAADPKRTYAADGSLHVVLSDTVGIGTWGSFPRVTEGESVNAFMTVVIVNPNSKHLTEAVDYALIASAQGDSTLPLLLYQDADYDALLRAGYDRDIAAQIAEGEDQSVIDELKACQAAGDDKYFTPRAAITRYAEEIAPKLVFGRWRPISMDDAIEQYLAGKLDANGFIAALNKEAK